MLDLKHLTRVEKHVFPTDIRTGDFVRNVTVV